MSTNFDEVLKIKDMDSFKWEYMNIIDSRVNDKTLAFWVADMDFACAPVILEAVKSRVDKRILGYSALDGDSFFRAVANWYKESFGWDIDKSSLCFSPGVVTALSALVNILTGEGDGVIIQRPVYPPFTRVVEANGRKVANNRLICENGYYRIDFTDLEEKCKANKLLILCSPHNPVGRVWTKEELMKVGEICEKNDVYIISDEIHCDLIRTGARHYILETLMPDYKNRIITCTAPSKTFNTAGLCHSHVVINDNDILVKWKDFMAKMGLNSPNPLSIAAAKAAFEEGRPWVLKVKAYIDENLDFMGNYIKEKMPEIGFVKPEGTYLTWLDFRSLGKTSAELFDLLIEQGGVMLQKGTDFGKNEGDGYMRLNAACPRKQLEEGLERICKLVHRVS